MQCYPDYTRCCGIVCMCSYTLVLRESSHSSMLVCPFTLVCGILGQSHIHLRLELITQVTVLFDRKEDKIITDISIQSFSGGSHLSCKTFLSG